MSSQHLRSGHALSAIRLKAFNGGPQCGKRPARGRNVRPQPFQLRRRLVPRGGQRLFPRLVRTEGPVRLLDAPAQLLESFLGLCDLLVQDDGAGPLTSPTAADRP